MEHKSKFIEDFRVGMQSTMEKIVTLEDIKKFADVSGDFNPVHLDEEFAKKTIFKGNLEIVRNGFLPILPVFSSARGQKAGPHMPGVTSLRLCQNVPPLQTLQLHQPDPSCFLLKLGAGVSGNGIVYHETIVH